MERFPILLTVVILVACLTPRANGDVAWDNGPAESWVALISQLDPVHPSNGQTVDDFVLPLGSSGETSWSINSVRWTGMYLRGSGDGPPTEFDFNILFYADRGDGNAPTGGPEDPTSTAIGFYHFANYQANESPAPEDAFEYEVELSPAFELQSGQKYWLAIQGIGAADGTGNHWFWSAHKSFQLHQAVLGIEDPSGEFGIPFWTNPYPDYIAEPWDTAFQLIGTPIPEPATLGSLVLIWVGGRTSRRAAR